MSDVPITKRPVVLRLRSQESVTVRRDIPYRDDLSIDLYLPPENDPNVRTPAVLFVTGYGDPGFEKFLGCKQKEMASYVTWAQLIAASGLIAVTYSNRQPVEDAQSVLAFLRENAQTLGIDESRLGIWSCSGNVPTALSLLMSDDAGVSCAVFCYGLTLDLDGHSAVADGASQFGYRNPAAGKSVQDLREGVPMLLVRAGRDETPHLNETLDRFVRAALGRNLPLTLINHATAPHAFDLDDDRESSRQVIRQILTFLRDQLLDRSPEGFG